MTERGVTLAERVWPSVGRPLVLIPVGSVEQHGPHLPLDTDTRIAVGVAGDLAARAREEGWDVAVAPAIAFGSSGEHQSFPGTLSIGRAALESVIVELCRSGSAWAERMVFVNGHGGNVASLATAVGGVRRNEARDVAWLSCVPREGVPEGDTHAGRVETSVMLHVQPDLVRTDRLEEGTTAPLREILPQLRAGGVAQVSANGILGDPRGASAVDGARLFRSICDRAWELLRAGHVGSDARLVTGSG